MDSTGNKPEPQENESREEHLPREVEVIAPAQRHEEWSRALEKASSQHSASPGQATSTPEPAGGTTIRIAKVAFPFLILLFYAAYRFFQPSENPFSESHGRIPEDPKSLTGITLAPDRQLSLTSEVEALLRELERNAEAQNWGVIITMIEAPEAAPLRGEPVIKAFEFYARTRSGQRSIAIERALLESERTLSRSSSRYQNLLREIRAAIVEQKSYRLQSLEDIARETNTIVVLLGPTADSSYEVAVRQKLAQRCEQLGDAAFAAGHGMLFNDLGKLREARQLYRAALQWIVAPEGWLTLTPLTPSDSAQIARISDKIRKVNQQINGLSLPFTESDSQTWDGKRGSPVHDAPGGRIF